MYCVFYVYYVYVCICVFVGNGRFHSLKSFSFRLWGLLKDICLQGASKQNQMFVFVPQQDRVCEHRN